MGLEERLKEVLNKNSRGWVRGSAECHRIRHLADGAHRHVYLERYTKGPRNGQLCVSKVFKSGSVFEDKYFDEDVKVTNKAAEIIKAFQTKSSAQIYLNEP